MAAARVNGGSRNIRHRVFNCFKGGVRAGPARPPVCPRYRRASRGTRTTAAAAAARSPNPLQPARNTHYSVHIYTEDG